VIRRGIGLIAATTLSLAFLTGCEGSLQQRLGLERPVPDELQVVRRAPLVMPPDMSLPPPGTRPAPHQDVSVAARESLVGRAAPVPAAASPGERALIMAVRGEADPEIRRRLLAETRELVDLDRSRFLLVLGFQQSQFEPKGEPLDPIAAAGELEREGRARRVVTIRTGSEPLGTGNGS
jgi:hypothetical protein